jgi:GT2 family glycosyltransferase
MATASEYHGYFHAPNREIIEAFNLIYSSTTEPIIAYIHDDLIIWEQGWDQRVLREFEDPSVGLVGFAGARGHFLPQAYMMPFHIPNMIRREFMSNLTDAEMHGARFTGERDAAVLDGMALFVRRSVLDKWGGWPVDKPVSYFLYSENLCCEVRRQGMRIRLVGVSCSHIGGRSSGTPLPYSYEEEHRYLWENSRDVLPYMVAEHYGEFAREA